MTRQYDDKEVNRPRNLIVLDATTPVEFSFDQYGKPFVLSIYQTADESTWPGGALWDCGWCMAQLLARDSCTTVTETVSKKKPPRRTSTQRSIPRNINLPFTTNTVETVLELGCGVGLTGLVAAAILKPKATILTDLEVVIEGVTKRNLEQNATWDKRTKTYKVQGYPVQAMPLCWGNSNDEDKVRNAMGGKAPDLILIGDVAYQHKPGAPSHFDVLHSTVQNMAGAKTIVMFGLRLRIPASRDLLDLFLETMDPVQSPISGEEVEPSLAKVKHNMTFHFLRRRP